MRFLQAILRGNDGARERARRLMQLFLSYADLPSLEVVKCDEVALDLVENTWTSRSGIECRLVIQLTRDSRVYIARGVRDTLLAVISPADAIHAHNRLHAYSKVTWHNASTRGDCRRYIENGRKCLLSASRECASDRSRDSPRELKFLRWRESRTCIGAFY